MTSIGIISLNKDIIVILAAIGTLIVARKGLETWSREIKGKADFEVTRNLSRSVYKLRDEIKKSRSPWVSSHEFPEGYNPMKKTSDLEAQAYSFIYSNRWKSVATALQNFEAQAFEAEALWGSGIKEKTDEFRQCARNLQVSFEADIQNRANDGQDYKSDREYGEIVRDAIWAIHDETNSLTLKIDSAISDIEKEIRPHSKRS